MLRRCCFVGILAVLSVRMPIFAQDWQPINPDELKMTADPAHPYDAIILYHEELSDDLKSHAYVYMRIKILTERGKERANVEIPFDGKNVGITDVRARTISPDGTITPFSGKVFDTTIVKGHGIKYLAKTLTLPNVEVGSIIEWKYTKYWERLVFAPHWTVQEDLYQKRAKFTFVPFLKPGYTIQDEHGILDRVYSQPIGLPAGTEIKTTVDNKMELELKDIPAYENEEFSPPSEVMKMRVNFYYGTDKMGKPAEFWKQEGKYWNKEVERFIGHSSAVAALSNEAVTGATTPEEKVRKIYLQVGKLKNLTYSERGGSMEEMLIRASKEKRTVDDVVRNSAGYRDELTRLFVAMVRAQNIPAFVMRVADRDEYFFNPKIPNPYQLTSEVAIVSLGGKDVFLDPGIPMCPYATLTWPHTMTQGLRQMPNGSADLAETPPISYKEAVSKRVARVTLAPDGSLQGTVILAWIKQEALAHRLSSVRTDDAGRKKELEEELQRILPNGSHVEFVSARGWDDVDGQLDVTFKVQIPSYASSAGKRTMMPAGFFETNRRQPFAHGERKNPIYFSYPFYTVDDVVISVPSGLHVESLPQPARIQTDYSFYQLKCSANGNAISFNRDFAIGGVAFRQEEYDGLRKFFSGVTGGDTEQVVLTTAAQ